LTAWIARGSKALAASLTQKSQKRRRCAWAIGIYSGDSPYRFLACEQADNPVVSAADISDVAAAFVADPFMVRHLDVWHMFFEVMDRQTETGIIALATSPNGTDWKYEQVILREPFHLSYPCVFEWQGDFYMIPETLPLSEVRLYWAESFPTRWRFVRTLLSGMFADPSPFRFRDRWWMYACPAPQTHDSLSLFSADKLEGPWREHTASPVVRGDPRRARPAGRVLPLEDGLVRYAQDSVPLYGSRVRAIDVLNLDENSYAERESDKSPILTGSGAGWNATGMHHLDAHHLTKGEWLACVDGFHLLG
jgi:hypothetical protein